MNLVSGPISGRRAMGRRSGDRSVVPGDLAVPGRTVAAAPARPTRTTAAARRPEGLAPAVDRRPSRRLISAKRRSAPPSARVLAWAAMPWKRGPATWSTAPRAARWFPPTSIASSAGRQMR